MSEEQHGGKKLLVVSGARGIFTVGLSYYPHFIVEEGFHGKVVEVTDCSVVIQVDEHMEGAEEWDNQVIITKEEAEGCHMGLLEYIHSVFLIEEGAEE